ncbi:MAG: Na+/H+ antiporter subunit E [Burkholderiales bacterium]|nr:Na+/H+ antiporter subunit E [Burkholderiales bacterium]
MTAALLRRGILFALLWWILSEGRAGSWGLGAIAVAVALWASVRLLLPASGRISVAGLFAFMGYFIWNSVRGGAQVALIALRGRQALQPDMLEMQLSLRSGAARILMVNALGLMPGSLGVRLEGDRLRLHVLDARMPIAVAVRALEARIEVIFREQP